ncbi:hypothetical protein SKAU_G00139220 [Synaphobranchus kaupii]|uniref:Uncharacterized protein n=1 Tax=Synaphobranchus kaupii TaxID=118154 RepID=A0A9Q1J3U0_SYNKA|nr:hypothetical protein SKAU_G00139220 [Synaphobranchus kaupii]
MESVEAWPLSSNTLGVSASVRTFVVVLEKGEPGPSVVPAFPGGHWPSLDFGLILLMSRNLALQARCPP